jgi:hypothetical protein
MMSSCHARQRRHLTNGWILAPDFKLIGEYERSLKEYPNIKVGEDFKGYKK